MKCIIAILCLIASSVGVSKAETKEEIREILVKKLRIESPDNDFADEATKASEAAFLRKHRRLLDSLGKNEIFYHLELTSDLYSESRPGFQPHAAYALYIYSKFHDEYSKEENEIISKKISDFAKNGWIPEKSFKRFRVIQSQQESTNPSPVRSKDLSKFNGDSESLAIEEDQENSKLKSERKKQIDFNTNRFPWIIVGVMLVGILVFFLKAFKGKSTS